MRAFWRWKAFGQYGFARQQGAIDLLSDAHGPRVMLIEPVGEGHQEAGVGDARHRENPLRWDRSRSPRTVPASRMYRRVTSVLRAFSSWSRTICPCGTPACSDASRSHSARSRGRRIVSV